MMPTSAVSILIACCNEEANVERCIREVVRVLPAEEILIIDGGTDRTFAIAEPLHDEFPGVRPSATSGDRGKGHAIKTGIATDIHNALK